jgi:hypothetical protein
MGLGVLLIAVLLVAVSAPTAPAAEPRIRHAEIRLDESAFRVTAAPHISSEEPIAAEILLSSPIDVPLGSPEPFLAVTAGWPAGSTPAELTLEVRGSTAGAEWSDWQLLLPDGDASTDREWIAGLLFLPKETARVQFRVTRERTPGSPPVPAALRAIFISPGASHEGVPASTGPSVRKTGKPPVVSRTGWGCPDGQESPAWTPEKTEVTHLIVHHTAGSNHHTDWAAVVRSIFALHTYTNGWGDIGYNFLIDPNGVIYEGRAGGDDIRGAHFSCANSNTMGMAFLGTFTSLEPTVEAWKAATQLLGWKAGERGIDPLGITHHLPTQLQLHTISGHRDANPSTAPGACPRGTECPGDALYPLLTILRVDVAEVLTAPSIVVVSPNGGEVWAVGRERSIAWSSSNLDPAAAITIRLSLDGGETSEELSIVDAGTTSVSWTPGPEHLTSSARVWIGALVDGEIESEDWSDADFAIAPGSRRRSTRPPSAD